MATGEDEMAQDASSSIIEFKHFDSVPLAEDHHFIKSKASDNSKNNVKMMKEWRILENNLPESIYVQVYETRIDLLRAVIIGSAGTPYHDGLFFFDIFLPPDYPNQPPQVYYHSHGYRLNPNLYKSGLLCLSLINTWSGKKQEKWTTNQSTLLQLLVSIQGLVLNARPYFNEPAMSSFQGSKLSPWINASNRYSMDAFNLSCKTMHKIMQHPPQNFERFVEEHFRQRATSILAAIDQCRQYVPVGQLGMTDPSFSSSKVGVSFGTRAQLTRTRGLLESVFKPFLPAPNPRRAIASTKENNKKGLFNRITSFVKKIFQTSED